MARGLSVAAILALCATPLAIGVSACSGFLVTSLLGPQWGAAQPIIAILSLLGLFSSFSFVCSGVLSANALLPRVFAGTALAACLRVVAILSVRWTGDLKLIALVSVVVVAAESVIFIALLGSFDWANVRRLTAPMTGVVAAGAATVSILWFVPMTWQAVPLGRFSALIAGGGRIAGHRALRRGRR